MPITILTQHNNNSNPGGINYSPPLANFIVLNEIFVCLKSPE